MLAEHRLRQMLVHILARTKRSKAGQHCVIILRTVERGQKESLGIIEPVLIGSV